MIELDYRFINSPLPILRFKKFRSQMQVKDSEPVNVLLEQDREENTKDFIKFVKMAGTNYTAREMDYGVLLEPIGRIGE